MGEIWTRPRFPMISEASRLWWMSRGPVAGSPGLRFPVSTRVISNLRLFGRCCTRERRQGGLRDLPSSSWETCCCSAVSSRASATAGLERVVPSWEASASACSSSGSGCPAVDVHHQPGQLPARGEAVAVAHQGGADAHRRGRPSACPQRQVVLPAACHCSCRIPPTWLAAVCIASSQAVRLLREKKDCRAALAWWGT